MKTRDISSGPIRTVHIDDIKLRPDGPVTLADRQGVFAHFCKCPADGAEFAAFSWRRKRPAEVAYTCPECSSGVDYLGSVLLNERKAFALAELPENDGAVEIYTIARILEKSAER